jgi:hypothetical protein
MRERVEIESLVLRVPGITPDDARELAMRIANELLARIDGLALHDHVHLADLRVTMPADAPRDRWPELVADRLIEALAEVCHG